MTTVLTRSGEGESLGGSTEQRNPCNTGILSVVVPNHPFELGRTVTLSLVNADLWTRIEIATKEGRMLGERATAFELDRGRQEIENGPAARDNAGRAETISPAIAPCPPVPFAPLQPEADDQPLSSMERAAPRRRGLAVLVGTVAIAALGAFFATGVGESDPGVGSATVAGSGEVARVTVHLPGADRVRPGDKAVDPTRSHHRGDSGGHGPKGNSNNPAGNGSDTDDPPLVGGDGDGDSAPLVTANLPVVGTVTVEQPEVPPLPDPPDVPLPDLPGPTLS